MAKTHVYTLTCYAQELSTLGLESFSGVMCVSAAQKNNCLSSGFADSTDSPWGLQGKAEGL